MTMNNVFAHYAYGILLEEDEPGYKDIVKWYEMSETTQGEIFGSPEHKEEYQRLDQIVNDLLAAKRKECGLSSGASSFFVAGEDTYKGSELAEGSLVFGFGVYALPTTDREVQRDLLALRRIGSVWHSWVTG